MASSKSFKTCLQLSKSVAFSPARAFVTMASQKTLQTSSPRLLGVLTPRLSTFHQRYKGEPPAGAIHGLRTRLGTTGTRTFKSTPTKRYTTAILNPRFNKDGQEMMVEMTPEASKRIKEIMTKDSNPLLALRIQVTTGGCHGFQYAMSLTTLPSNFSAQKTHSESSPPLNEVPIVSNTLSVPQKEENASWDAEDEEDAKDTVFRAKDGTCAKVVMDGASLKLLKGSKIHFTRELIGSQFKIVDNPFATSSCGCGTSFDSKALDL